MWCEHALILAQTQTANTKVRAHECFGKLARLSQMVTDVTIWDTDRQARDNEQHARTTMHVVYGVLEAYI